METITGTQVKYWYLSFEHHLCFAFVSTYVAILYLVPEKIRKLPRNHETHIKYRMVGASIATIGSMVVFYALLSPDTTLSYWHLIGVQLDNAISCVTTTIGLMTIFYAGPVICQLWMLIHRLQYRIDRSGRLLPRKESSMRVFLSDILRETWDFEGLGSIVLFRNAIFAPITEEIVFRSLMVPLLFSYYCSQANDNVSEQSIASIQTSVIIVCPLYFGIAHLHHLYEAIRTEKSFLKPIIMTSVQFLYTSIFGSIAVIFFLRSGSILPPIVSHIYCNIQGLPDTSFMNKPGNPYTSSSLSLLYPYRYFLLLCHVGGLVVFAFVLYPLTSTLSKYSIYNDKVIIR